MKTEHTALDQELCTAALAALILGHPAQRVEIPKELMAKVPGTFIIQAELVGEDPDAEEADTCFLTVVPFEGNAA